MNNQAATRAFAEEFAVPTASGSLDAMIRIAGSFAGGLTIVTLLAAVFAR